VDPGLTPVAIDEQEVDSQGNYIAVTTCIIADDDDFRGRQKPLDLSPSKN
jgi:hypothetical protein